jgi:hypothetical protein
MVPSWFMTPCTLLRVHQCFADILFLHVENRQMGTIGSSLILVPNYQTTRRIVEGRNLKVFFSVMELN